MTFKGTTSRETILNLPEYFQMHRKMSYQCNNQNPELRLGLVCMIYLASPSIFPLHLDTGNLQISRSRGCSGLFEIRESGRYNRAPTIAAATFPYCSTYFLNNKIFWIPFSENFRKSSCNSFKWFINWMVIKRKVISRNV